MGGLITGVSLVGGGGDSEKGEVELVFCSCSIAVDVCVPFSWRKNTHICMELDTVSHHTDVCVSIVYACMCMHAHTRARTHTHTHTELSEFSETAIGFLLYYIYSLIIHQGVGQQLYHQLPGKSRI